ncbi:hypothetical protein [Yersinia phage vB_Yru_GN1]|uniref:Uncharacterized protein n=1 Tax=Yersinia phage vB_Yru_GN1 TaxID=3074381 RepID=A0AA86IYY4_9CAUD|nr:hypothetical protein [Yersinia phage vB_Yru_GN1]
MIPINKQIKPINNKFVIVMVLKAHGSFLFGQMFNYPEHLIDELLKTDSDKFIQVRGQSFPVDGNEELFRMFGYGYTQRYIDVPLTSLQKLLKFLGFKVKMKQKKNPEYVEGTFNIPDLTSQICM